MDINDFLKWFKPVAKDFYVDDFGFIRTGSSPYCLCPLQVLTNREQGYVTISMEMGLDPYPIMQAADCPVEIRDPRVLTLRNQMLEMIHANPQST